MNAFARLSLIGATALICIWLFRWEPALLFPIGVLASVFGTVWWLSAKYNEQQAMDELADSSAIRRQIGPQMAALANEEHHDRWAE
ncbi:hypothetical protein [Tsukamurella sp. USMM236]|uniref:hypothetical protein n=1 Tax=Tsukamurella sp. USMM236 TaxID=3081301 RepID=UPI00301A7C77